MKDSVAGVHGSWSSVLFRAPIPALLKIYRFLFYGHEGFASMHGSVPHEVVIEASRGFQVLELGETSVTDRCELPSGPL